MLPAAFDVLPAWLSGSDEAPVVISSRVRLARNLAGHHFPGKSLPLERERCFEQITAAAASVPSFAGVPCFNMADLDHQRRQLLLERRAASAKLVAADGDRGTVSTPDAGLSLLVNEEDHVRIQAIGPGLSAIDLFERAEAADTELGEVLEYAFEPSRGFLTSSPANAGTGLRVSFLLHLPGLALTRSLDQVLSGASQIGFSARGFFGEGSDVVGHFFQFANRAACGMNEEEFVHETSLLATRIVAHETAARTRLFAEAASEMAEKVWRSLGILRFARALSLHEFLNLSSALRLGMGAGLLPGLCTQELDRLTLACMPAHLDTAVGRTIPAGERDSVRAGLVREQLAGIG